MEILPRSSPVCAALAARTRSGETKFVGLPGMVRPRFDSVPTDDVHARVHRRQSFWLHAVSFGCCLLPPLALLVVWDWHETGVIGPIAALSSISVHNRRAGHRAWMFESRLIGPVGFMAKGDQQPPYYTPLYLPWLERSLRRDQPWPVDIVRNVRQDDVIVVLRPMLDEVLDALDARGAATPSFTLVSINHDSHLRTTCFTTLLTTRYSLLTRSASTTMTR